MRDRVLSQKVDVLAPLSSFCFALVARARNLMSLFALGRQARQELKREVADP